MIISKPQPQHDSDTGEWLYRGKWHDKYPYAEIDRDDAAYEDYQDARMERLRENID